MAVVAPEVWSAPPRRKGAESLERRSVYTEQQKFKRALKKPADRSVTNFPRLFAPPPPSYHPLSLFLPSKIHGDNRGTRIIIVILLVSSPRLINPPPRFDRRYDDTFSFSAITVETLIILVEKGNKYCGEIGFLANTYFSSVYARYDREGLSVSCIHLRLNVKCNSRGGRLTG